MTTPGSPLPPVYVTGLRDTWMKSKNVNKGMLRKYKEHASFGLYKWSIKKYPK